MTKQNIYVLIDLANAFYIIISSWPSPIFARRCNTEIIDSVSTGLEEDPRIYHRSPDHSFYKECPAASLGDQLHVFTCGEERVDHGSILTSVVRACEEVITHTQFM